MSKIVIYCRVSTEEQCSDDSFSLPNQEARCKQYLKAKNRPFNGTEACRGLDVKASILEEVLLEEIKALASSELFQRRTVDEAKKLFLQDNAFGQRERKNELERKLGDLDEQFVRWSEAYSKGAMTFDQFEKFNHKLIVEQQKMQSEVEEIEEQLVGSVVEAVQIEDVLKAIKGFNRLWGKMEIGEKKEFLRLVVEHFKVAKHSCRIKLLVGEEKEFEY